MEVKSQKYDRSNMRQTILGSPKQFRIGLEAAKNVKISNFEFRISNLIVCGMGGSALPGDILDIWLEEHKINLPLRVHRNYGLPHQIKIKNSLIVCISYSGNTEETLSAFEEARKKKLKIAAISSGGKLVKLCELHKVPLAVIPAGYQPRMALGFQFSALMKILANSGLIKDNLESIASLENSLKPRNLENRGREIAKNLKNGLPIIYASRKLRHLARIWKIKFNENSKTPAFYNYFPELNHNELAGFTCGGPTSRGGRTSIIILREPTDHPRIKKRMQLTSDILMEKGINVDIIEIMGKDTINKTFSSILLADWASYYLALEYGVDPTPVKLNDEFKKRLA